MLAACAVVTTLLYVRLLFVILQYCALKQYKLFNLKVFILFKGFKGSIYETEDPAVEVSHCYKSSDLPDLSRLRLAAAFLRFLMKCRVQCSKAVCYVGNYRNRKTREKPFSSEMIL